MSKLFKWRRMGQCAESLAFLRKKAEMEMSWIDDAHIKDGKLTKGEIKVGIRNSFVRKNPNADLTKLDAIIDKYAGDDGTFSKEEYMQLKNDPVYKKFVEQYGAHPWINVEEQ